VVVASVIASATTPAVAQGEAAVRLLPPISSVDATDGPFTVFIVVDGLAHHGRIGYDDDRDTVVDREEPSDGLAAFEFSIEYDQTVVALDAVEPGPELELAPRRFQCLPPQEEPGHIHFGCLSFGSEQAGLQGSLTLARVEFRPVGRGASALLVDAGLSGPLGDEVPVSVNAGAVHVTGQVPVLAVSPTTGLSPVSTAGPQGTPGPANAGQVTGGATPLATDTTFVLGDPTDPEAINDDIASGGGDSGNGVFWAAIVLGGALVVGSMGLVAILLRRRSNIGGV
jgi:hypothetical protein